MRYMKRRQPYNDLMGTSISIAGSSVVLGLSSNIVESMGGNADALNTISKYQVPLAKVQGGNILLNTLMDLNTKTKKQLRRLR